MKACFTYGLLFFLIVPIRLYAQAPAPPQPLQISFTQTSIRIETGDIISNVIRIVNTSERQQRFSIQLDFPSDWRFLFSNSTLHELAPKDSLFLPVRLIPNKQLTGNSKFMISAYAFTPEDVQIGSNFFWAYTERKKSWILSIEPSSKNYFKNGSNKSLFRVNVLNTGTEAQPVHLDLDNLGLYAVLTDSNERIIKDPKYDFTLRPYEDTTFTFQFKYINGIRNNYRTDIETHKPQSQKEERQYSLMVNTVEPTLSGTSDFELKQKVVFMRLTDDKKVNAFGKQLPLIMDINVNNILNNTTFTNINLRGNANIRDDRMLVYNFQTTTSSSGTENIMDNAMYYAGYFYGTGSVQGGFISGGLMGLQSYGRGLRYDYYPTRKARFMVFMVNNEGLTGSVNNYAVGGSFQTRYYKSNTLKVEYGRGERSNTGDIQQVGTITTGFRFLRTQSINVQHSTSVITPARTRFFSTQSTYGHFNSITYSGSFARSRITTSHTMGQSGNGYGGSNLGRTYYNQSSRYNFNARRSVMIVNSYNETTLGTALSTSYAQNNMLAFNFVNKEKTLQPNIFFNNVDYVAFKYYTKGVGLSYSSYNAVENSRVSTQIQAGYITPYQTAIRNDQFFLMWSGFANYRNISLTARYNLSTAGGMLQQATTNLNSNVTPQNFTGSFQHQYLFANNKIILQSGLNYYYNNVFNQHSLSLYPEAYYYTNDGWRFRVSLGYNFMKGELISYSRTGSSDEPETYTNQSMLIGLGIRKEFGIPIPFMKRKFADLHFVVFYDMNGDGQKQGNETPIENIVVGLGTEEVLSNADGEAHLRNFPIGVTTLYAKQLSNYDDWFANISDSIMINKDREVLIPFVRGVKIKGKVNIDREAIRADAQSKFDLSRIKITANGHKVYSTLTDFDGNFEVYLPYGKYIITMDEKVLGDKYRIARNNYEINSSKETDGLYLSFMIIERKRKVVKKVFTPTQNEAPELKNETPNRNNQAPRRRTNTSRRRR